MLRFLQGPRIPILYYHEIGSQASKHVVTPADFESQLDWLGEAGVEVLSLDDWVAVRARRRAAPARGVVLTFDDGRAGVRDFAAPALARRGLPAMLYLVTGWLDGAPKAEVERYSGFVDWQDLPALETAGFTLGSHGVSHSPLKRLPKEEIVEEVGASRRRLQEMLGHEVKHFSFPYGRRTRESERIVREAGYATAVVTGDRVNGRFGGLHRIFRLRVDGTATLDTFRARVLGRSEES